MKKQISYCDEQRRKHPIRYWWTYITMEIEYFWAWVADKPNCDGKGLRTGKKK